MLAVDGNRITIKEPLLHDLRPEWTPTLTAWDAITEVGIEGIRFEFLYNEYNVHHVEPGNNAVYLTNTAHSWVRDVTVVNGDSGVLTDVCSNVTIDDVRVYGRKYHYAVHMGDCYDVLARDIYVAAPVVHTFSFNTGSRMQRLHALGGDGHAGPGPAQRPELPEPVRRDHALHRRPGAPAHRGRRRGLLEAVTRGVPCVLERRLPVPLPRPFRDVRDRGPPRWPGGPPRWAPRKPDAGAGLRPGPLRRGPQPRSTSPYRRSTSTNCGSGSVTGRRHDEADSGPGPAAGGRRRGRLRRDRPPVGRTGDAGRAGARPRARGGRARAGRGARHRHRDARRAERWRPARLLLRGRLLVARP